VSLHFSHQESIRSLARPLCTAWSWLRRHLWIVLPLLVIPALGTFWTVGLPLSADGPTHLARVVLIDYHLRHGALYLRWLPEVMSGRGDPTFNYYALAAYYLVELAHLVAGLNFVDAFAAASALLILAGGCR